MNHKQSSTAPGSLAKTIEDIPRRVWGNALWTVMFAVALGIGNNPPADLQMEIRKFFESLIYCMPCPECREHYAEIWDGFPIDPFLVSSASLFQWVSAVKKEVDLIVEAEKTQKQKHISHAKQQTPNAMQQREVATVAAAPQQRDRPARLTTDQVKSRIGSSGTPAGYATAVNSAHSRALDKLRESAKYWSRGCSC